MSTVVVGRIKGLHGVRGAIKIESFCGPLSAIFNYRPWTLIRPGPIALGLDAQALAERSLTVQAPIKVHGSGETLVVRCVDIEDRDQAQAWLGSEIHVPKSALPKLKEGEYYWNDLIGLTVTNREGVLFGQITQLMETGSNDVLVIHGERERLVPYLPGQYVLDIDLGKREMIVDWDADF
jgi:16S rRNA processing protein RimM